MTSINRLWCEFEANVTVTFDTLDFDEATVLELTSNFRKQIKALGVKRDEYGYTNSDSPVWATPRQRDRCFVALTKHAEIIFTLARTDR